MTRVTLTRRFVLTAPLALAAAPARSAAVDDARDRVAALDWTLASACLSIGLVPVGVAEQRLYRRWVRDPALPASVAELGLRIAPSLEGLTELRPDLILVNALDEPLRPRLEEIAPTLSLAVYGAEGRPMQLSAVALRDLGRRFGRAGRAEAVLAEADAVFSRLAATLTGSRHAPVLPFTFEDSRHLRIYGTGSLFVDTLERLGLASAWAGPTNAWGTAEAEIAAIADYPDATLVAVEPIPADAKAMFEEPGLWAALATERRVPLVTLPPVWPYGEIGAARRFAELLTPALSRAEARHAG